MSKLLTKRRDPYIFMLTIGIAGIILLFAWLSLVYILRKSGKNWVSFELPGIFWWSTIVIIISSLTLQLATISFKKDKFSDYTWLTGVTLTLGFIFICTQLIGWQQLVSQGLGLQHTSAAFLYILSGLHILHIIGGIILLFISFLHALKRSTYVDAFIYSVNPPNKLRLYLISIYWHFVDILWIYLFLFLLYHHS